MSWLKRVFGVSEDPKEKLTKAVFAELRRRGVEPRNIDEFNWRFDIKRPDGEEAKIGLRNIFHAWELAEALDRPAVVTRFVDGIFNTPLDEGRLEDVTDQLMPLLRCRAKLSMHQLHIAIQSLRDSGVIPDDDMLWQPFGGDLAIRLGIDHPDTIKVVNKSNIAASDLSFEQALLHARRNLKSRLPVMEFERLGDHVNAFFSPSAEDYQSSLLLLPPSDFLVGLELVGPPVVLVPARNQMFVTGANEPDGVETLIRIAEAGATDLPHPCSFMLFTHDGAAWQTYVPTSQTNSDYYARTQRFNLAIDYAEQTALVEELHELTARDAHVAEMMLFEKEGHVTSVATWTDGVTDGLLPRADTISFVKGENDILQVPWEDAVSIVGERLQQEPDLFPPRFGYTTFPDEAQLLQLERHAIID